MRAIEAIRARVMAARAAVMIRGLMLAAVLVSGPVVGAENSSAANLNRLLQQMESFTAGFEQMVLDSTGTRLQESKGQVALKRPGQFRWKTLEPFPQLLVSDGETLWLYDEDLEQVTRKPLDERIGQTPALLLSGDLNTLAENFQVSGPTEGQAGLYELVPLDEDLMFSRMRLYFEAGVLQEMQLEDSLGQRTSLLFHDQQINPDLSDDRFRFEVPPGVDVISEQ